MFAIVASAQIIFLSFPADLTQYLQLTAEQVSSISDINSMFYTYRNGKLQRASQVQVEIGRELAKETVDPMALGVRYLELEQIRREMNSEQAKTVTAVQNVLTAAQKTKLATLQDVLILSGTACNAVNQNMLALPSRSSNLGEIPVPVPSGNGVYISSALVTGTPCTSGATFSVVVPASVSRFPTNP